MFIPIGTDAPLYFFPYATIASIVVNCVAFGVCWTAGPGAVEPWILAHGDGLHPLQWVTSIFLHADPIHLLGNMFFLWIFGLIIEGKIGWFKFLAIYLGIGVGQCALEQLIMSSHGSYGSLGASAAISGLMAIAMIWAPQNEINIVALNCSWPKC